MTLTPLRRIRPLQICHDGSQLTRPLLVTQPGRSQPRRYFHPSRRKLADEFPDHYATLELPASAAPAEIKKQFYALSKKYHPDVNHDPSASERFVKISEAYHILGSAEKKSKYDRDFHRAHNPASRHGSHHSRSGGPAGGRPASGLSKRRGTFRGPPPSFYAQGGYGTSGPRRQRAQEEADARGGPRQEGPADPNHPSGLGSQPGYNGGGGYSSGSRDDGYFDPEPDMPYWDRESHKRTHEGLGARREANEERRRPPSDPYATSSGPGLIGQFFIVSAVVAVATIGATMIMSMFGPTTNQSRSPPRRRQARDEG